MKFEVFFYLLITYLVLKPFLDPLATKLGQYFSGYLASFTIDNRASETMGRISTIRRNWPGNHSFFVAFDGTYLGDVDWTVTRLKDCTLVAVTVEGFSAVYCVTYIHLLIICKNVEESKCIHKILMKRRESL